MNQCYLSGLSGKDSVLKYTAGGTAILEFSLATSKKIKEEFVTNWHICKLIGKKAEALTIKKGQRVMVAGEISNRSFKDKTGQTKYISEVICFEVSVMGTPKDSSDNISPTHQEQFDDNLL